MHPRPCLAAVCALALAGCGSDDPDPAADRRDPAIAAALAGPVMTDPDLFFQDRAQAAIAGGGPPSAALPPIDSSPEAVAQAKQEAERLAGGRIAPAPKPQEADSPGEPPVTAAQLAGQLKGLNAGCAARLDYAMAWSLRLPAALAIYPRANLTDAAGTDAAGCRVRAVSFVTPVDVEDVAAFYHARATKARYAAKGAVEGDVRVIAGDRAGAAFILRARRGEDGLTRVDLATRGG